MTAVTGFARGMCLDWEAEGVHEVGRNLGTGAHVGYVVAGVWRTGFSARSRAAKRSWWVLLERR